MQIRERLLSEHVRRRVQLGVVPVVVGSVTATSATDLIDLVGVGGALALLAVLVAVQTYLIVARVWLDFLGAG